MDVKAFESPSSLTEDSSSDGSKPLKERGFNLSYKDMQGVADVKTTTAEEETEQEQTTTTSEEHPTDSFSASASE